MKVHGTSDRGIPILSLRDKVESLLHCLEVEQDGPLREDAMGHLFDLIHHIAPGYEFGRLRGIAAIAEHYGSHPTPIHEERP